MTNEERKAIKKWRESADPFIKKYAKEFKLHKRSYAVWKDKNGVFYCLTLVECVPGNKPCLDVEITVKPLWLDDLYWTIEKSLESNITKPKSLRAVGVWTVSGLQIKKETLIANEFSDMEMERLVKSEIEGFAKLPEFTQNDFVKAVENGEYDHLTGQILTAIHNDDYEKARFLAQQGIDDPKSLSTFYKRAIEYIESL